MSTLTRYSQSYFGKSGIQILYRCLINTKFLKCVKLNATRTQKKKHKLVLGQLQKNEKQVCPPVPAPEIVYRFKAG